MFYRTGRDRDGGNQEGSESDDPDVNTCEDDDDDDDDDDDIDDDHHLPGDCDPAWYPWINKSHALLCWIYRGNRYHKMVSDILRYDPFLSYK